MLRHMVRLTFDFDTSSGFIARATTTPTPLSRGETAPARAGVSSQCSKSFAQPRRKRADLGKGACYNDVGVEVAMA
jgi:hypothetical protein